MSDMTGGSLAHGSSALDSNVAFNLCIEKDVVTLLRRIHQSPLSPEDKNELRDMVFSFRNTPDAVVTDELKKLFTESGFTLEGDTPSQEESTKVVSPAQESVPQTRLGSTRPRPSFASTVTAETSDVVVTEPAPTTTAPPISEAAKIQTPDAPKEVKVKVAPVATSVPETQATAPSIPEESPTKSPVIANAPERIKEIKKEVNLLVGNPVNLIDVNNEVGREYMNSLLDAMKKNNGGSAGEVSAAMERLEKAFVSVKETVAAGATNEVTSKPTVSETVPAPEAEEVPTQDIKKTPSIEVEDSVESEVKIETRKATSGFASVHQTHVKEVEPINPPAQTVPTAPPVSEIDVPKSPVSELTTEPAPTETTQTAKAGGGIMSVAKEKQIQDLLTAQKKEAAVTDQQKETARVASMDPLMTPEVTSGLQQLLSEWNLFKSSGIFGTGGSGMEHPLYKQLATLNMTAIVAGRFEGVSPQIKRSITDYMNGWRYEEGIMQEQGESFEHYLRRVIKHILDKQPLKPTA